MTVDPDLSMRTIAIDFGGRDVDDPTTTDGLRFSNRYTNSGVLLILSGHNQPNHEGLCSCKQSKNEQEQDKEAI